ncbi:MAG: glycosyltransferase WbuB, partial [Erythrobacter sp.]|nr:glycosyltransferase WbuB [Erythrobacter sp.]
LAGLLDARDAWDAMRNRAEAHVRAHHDWAANAHNYLSVYHLLLAQSHGNSTSGARAASQAAG